MAATRTRKINIYVNGVQVQNDIRSITKAMRELENRTRLLDRSSMEYVHNMKRIKELKGIIYEHNQALNVTNHNLFTLKGLANAFNKYWPVVMGTIGSIAGLVFSVKAVTDEFAAFDDKLTDIMKTTGLSREEVVKLDADLQKINTRTARTELLDLAYVAGKLGITSRDEILQFVRASDKIVVALQKDLGGSAEDAINTLGKLVQVFKLKEEYGMEEAMLKVGSSINSLGMASSANEENIVGFSKRVAGIGKLANIQVPHILGLGATIDALAISTEVAATAYSMFMGRMTQDTATFATIAGMKLDDFVALLNTDANEAFIRVLEALNNTGEGFTALRSSMEAAGLDGERAVAVMSTLSQQTDFLRQQQELSNKAFILGTSVIDEFNIKNNSAQAIIDKNIKKINEQRVALGEKLMPVYASGQSALVKFYQTIGVLVNFLSEHGRGLIVATSALIGYKLAMMATAIWNERLVAGTRAFAIAEAFSSMQTKLATKWLLMKGIAYDLYRGKVNLATAATEIFSLALGMTGLPALIALLATAASSFWLFSSASKNASKETLNLADEIKRLTDERRKSLIEEQVNVKALSNTIGGLNEKTALRSALINRLKAAYPELLSYVDADRISNEELNKALIDVNENIKQRIELAVMEASAEAYKNKMIEVRSRMIDVELKMLKTQKNFDEISKKRRPSIQTENWHYINMAQLRKDYNAIQEESILLEEAMFNAHNEISKKKQKANDIQINQYKRQIEVLQQQREEAAKQEQIDKAYISSIDIQIGVLQKKISTIKQISLVEDQYSELKEKEAINAELKRYNRREVDKFTHEQNIRKIELEFMQGRFDNYQLDALKRAELDNDIEKKKSEIMEAYDKLEDKKQGYKLKKDFDFKQKSTQLMKDFRNGTITSEREYQDKLLQLEIDTLADRLREEKDGSDEYIAINAELQAKLLEQYTRRLDYEKKLRDAAGVDEIQEVREKYDAMLKELGIYGKNVADMTTNQQLAFTGLMIKQQTELDRIDAERIKTHFTALKSSFEFELAELKAKHAEELNQENLSRGDRRRLRVAQSREIIDFTNEHVNKMIELAQKLKNEGKLEGLILSDETLYESEKEELLDLLTELYEKLGALKAKSDEFNFGIGDIFGFSISDWDKFIKNIDDSWDKLDWEDKFQTIAVGLLALSDLTKQYYSLMEKYQQRDLERTETQYDEKKKALQKQLDFGLISQENYNAQVERLDKELDIKKAMLQREQARREKELAIFNATIQGAVAVVQTLPKPWLAALVATAVAFQIALIAATPLPEMPGAESGGSLVQRSQDGKRFNASYNPAKRGYVKGPTVLVGENGMEYVVPSQAMNNPTIAPVLAALEQARLDKNLATVDFNDLLFSQIYNSRQNGGFSSVSSAPQAAAVVKMPKQSPDKLTGLLTENLQMLTELNSKLDKPFKGYVSLYGQSGLYKAMEDNQILKENSNL